MIYPYSYSFKSFIENDHIISALFSHQIRWGDVEDFEDVENRKVNEDKKDIEILKDFIII